MTIKIIVLFHEAGRAYFFANLSLGACLAMCLFFHQSQPGRAYKLGAYKK